MRHEFMQYCNFSYIEFLNISIIIAFVVPYIMMGSNGKSLYKPSFCIALMLQSIQRCKPSCSRFIFIYHLHYSNILTFKRLLKYVYII